MARAKLEVCSLCDGNLGDSLRVTRTLHEEGYSERFGLAAEGADEKTIVISVVAVLHREAGGGVLAEERVKHHGGLLLGVDVLLVEDADFHGAIEELREGGGVAGGKRILGGHAHLGSRYPPAQEQQG